MSAIMEDISLPAKVNIHELKKIDSGNLVGHCAETNNKKHPKPAPVAPRGLERPATTQPTCCPRYPPGTTLLECRLEGDQPVAHVVQVLTDGNTTTQKMCLLVETKQSPSGPYSRVISRPIECPTDPNECSSNGNKSSNGSTQLQTAYRLESRECREGPVAMITKLPITESSTGDSNVIMTLETTKGAGQPDGPSSRILYGPAIGETLRASSCAENSRNLPTSIIECNSTSKQTSARITRCPDVSSHKPDHPTSGLHDTIETKVDEGGPKAFAINFEAGEKPSTKKKAKSTSNEQKTHHQQVRRKGSDTSKSNCSPLKCLTICPASKKLEPPTERRNGLDPDDNLPINLFKRIPRREDCPCNPDSTKGECRSGSSSVERGQRARSEPSKLLKCVLVPCNVAEKLRRETDKLSEDFARPEVSSRPKIRDSGARKPSDCGKTISSTRVRRNGSRSEVKTTSKRGRSSTEDCPEDFVPEIRSQELLTRFRDYFSPHQLQRYEVCRSRRNGLQDQCQLPIPRAVLELKKREMLSRDSREKSSKDQLAQPVILVCSDRKSAADCDEHLREFVESVCV